MQVSPKKSIWRNRGVSFRNKVLGGETRVFPRVTKEILEEKVKLYFEEGNARRPMVFFDDSLVDIVSLPWKEAFVVKILGLFLSFTVMREKFRVIWKLSAMFEIMDVGNCYFMVEFDSPADRDMVIFHGPWMINNRYLEVKKWSPSFNPLDGCFGQTMF